MFINKHEAISSANNISLLQFFIDFNNRWHSFIDLSLIVLLFIYYYYLLFIIIIYYYNYLFISIKIKSSVFLQLKVITYGLSLFYTYV
jgi:hypothetical protein